ncbi:MAG TPA: PaaI family thioesterase [Acidimicrobiales bacterium]|nr:PaaI family thioesterase [Acidimicrobiales bacterium]
MFIDALRRQLPPPPAALTLGFEVVEVDPAGGSIVVAFAAGPSFTNPFGEVLGGFLAAMLYDTVGPAVLATLGPGEFILTHDLDTIFLRPTPAGRLVGRGRVVGRDGDLLAVTAELESADGELLATATANVQVVQRHAPPAISGS